jgi:hypothetical protein
MRTGYDEDWFNVDSNWNVLLWKFDKAFKNFKNNMQFVGQLMERACELAWDDNVNEENIERFEQYNNMKTKGFLLLQMI